MIKRGWPSWSWPDARGYIGLASFILCLLVLAMIYFSPNLLSNDAFLILATALVITGWVNGPVTWAYGSTKNGQELSASNAELIREQATGPHETVVVNAQDDPIPVKEGKTK